MAPLLSSWAAFGCCRSVLPNNRETVAATPTFRTMHVFSLSEQPQNRPGNTHISYHVTLYLGGSRTFMGRASTDTANDARDATKNTLVTLPNATKPVQ